MDSVRRSNVIPDSATTATGRGSANTAPATSDSRQDGGQAGVAVTTPSADHQIPPTLGAVAGSAHLPSSSSQSGDQTGGAVASPAKRPKIVEPRRSKRLSMMAPAPPTHGVVSGSAHSATLPRGNQSGMTPDPAVDNKPKAIALRRSTRLSMTAVPSTFGSVSIPKKPNRASSAKPVSGSRLHVATPAVTTTSNPPGNSLQEFCFLKLNGNESWTVDAEKSKPGRLEYVPTLCSLDKKTYDDLLSLENTNESEVNEKKKDVPVEKQELILEVKSVKCYACNPSNPDATKFFAKHLQVWSYHIDRQVCVTWEPLETDDKNVRATNRELINDQKCMVQSDHLHRLELFHKRATDEIGKLRHELEVDKQFMKYAKETTEEEYAKAKDVMDRASILIREEGAKYDFMTRFNNKVIEQLFETVKKLDTELVKLDPARTPLEFVEFEFEDETIRIPTDGDYKKMDDQEKMSADNKNPSEDNARKSGDIEEKSGDVKEESGDIKKESKDIVKMLGDIEVKSGDNGQKSGNNGQKSGDNGQKSGDNGQKSGDNGQKSNDDVQMSEDVELKPNAGLNTGDDDVMIID